jgi:hypoxanthine phosphoribosyltransferase
MQMPRGKRVVFSEEAIRQRTQEIGRKISQDYADKDLILVSVLKGSLYFFADLSRAIDIPVQLDFITIGAYPVSTSQKGIVRITKDLDLDITGRHVLVVEDIIRTGLTTAYLVQNLVSRMPASVKVCTQMINVPIAYCGFEISETRLIGYGMDVGEWGRNLPYIAEINRAEP